MLSLLPHLDRTRRNDVLNVAAIYFGGGSKGDFVGLARASKQGT